MNYSTYKDSILLIQHTTKSPPLLEVKLTLLYVFCCGSLIPKPSYARRYIKTSVRTFADPNACFFHTDSVASSCSRAVFTS